ncbi:uncharacterized protein P884DRAFT_228409, partial [Thermothelomyces heterothallicus CBS 202.75]|uniref:uncharacterized protein n=1 Tax=Thermothelomyces heterothallicus CBS 202.75 TaxID=1149848 RepID=UPI003742A5A3
MTTTSSFSRHEQEQQEAIPPAQKARTVAHMNADHRADMRYILMRYGADPPVPPSYFSPGSTCGAHKKPAAGSDADRDRAGDADRDPIMLDIDLDRFTVRLPAGGSAAGSVHAVAFDPPLRTWAERRERLVEMTRVAREAAAAAAENGVGVGVGVTRVVVVDEYMPPRVPYDLAIFLAVLAYYASLALVRAGMVTPGSPAARWLEAARFPGGAAGFRWLVDALLVPVLGIHLAETWWLERSRLRKFGVRRGSRAWWLWVGSVFIEGAMAFKRFDIIVEKLKRRE